MKQKKYTKRALCMSLLSMLLCCSMLIGTTFAWFTDSVTSGKNQIVAGNLDVELEYATYDSVTGVFSEWTSVEGAENLFDPEALWEPGHTEVVYLRITNKGTLALTYKLGVDVLTEKSGVNVEGNPFKLSDYLVFKHTKLTATEGTITNPYKTREEAREAAGTEKGLGSYSDPGKDEDRNTLLPNESVYGALIVYMPTDVGNEANYRNPADLATIAEGDLPDYVPYIELGVSLYATQTPHEKDSFNEDYDKNAIDEIDRVMIDVGGVTMAVSETFAESISENASGKIIALTAICADDLMAISAMDQAGLISTSENGPDRAVISIEADINMSGKTWTPLNGLHRIINGNGHTISNLTCAQGTNGKSGFLYDGGDATISDLTLENVTASGTQVGAFAGAADGITIVNCKLAGTVNLSWAQNTTSDYQETYGSVGLIVGNTNAHSSIEVDIAELVSYELNMNDLESALESAAGYEKNYQPYVQYANGGIDLTITGETIEVGDTTELQAAVQGANSGDIVVLTGDAYDFKNASVNVSGEITISAADGESVELSNVQFELAKGSEVSFENVKFTGATSVHAQGTGDTVSFTGCTFDIAPKRLYNNGRAAAILGQNQACTVDLYLEDCTFNYQYAGEDFEDPYNMAVFMWSAIDHCEIRNCTFNGYGFVAVKFMNVAENAEILIEGNTFNVAEEGAPNNYYNVAVQICPQHDNAFTVTFRDNDFNGDYVEINEHIENGDTNLAFASIDCSNNSTMRALTKVTLVVENNRMNGEPVTEANVALEDGDY